MSKAKKNNGCNSTPDAVLEEYRKMKGKSSHASANLSQKIMEITQAGRVVSGDGVGIVQDICIICDSQDVCNPCDWNDFNCRSIDGICITKDGCDTDDFIHIGKK